MSTVGDSSSRAPDTRRILAAARRRFGRDGYERTMLRAVAADVGIDPALVVRYFGSSPPLRSSRSTCPTWPKVDANDVADALLPRFFAVWEMRHVFATQVAPKLAAVTPDHPEQRAGLMGAVVIGLATTRYVLANLLSLMIQLGFVPPLRGLRRRPPRRRGGRHRGSRRRVHQVQVGPRLNAIAAPLRG